MLQPYLETVLSAVSCQGDLLQLYLLNVHHCNMKKRKGLVRVLLLRHDSGTGNVISTESQKLTVYSTLAWRYAAEVLDRT